MWTIPEFQLTFWRRRFSWTGYKKPMSKYEFFEDSEVEGLNDSFVLKLVAARKKTIELDPDRKGVPFRISSGFRSLEKNKSVIGAVADSSHTKGLAVDLRVYSSREASLIIQTCYQAGINRCGLYVDNSWQLVHIHVDSDQEKISDVLFVKKEEN